jgi:hypothetical protein
MGDGQDDKTKETRRIYEDLLNEITEAMRKQGRDSSFSSKKNQESPAKIQKQIIKLGAIPIQGLSPRVLKAIG